MEEYYNTVERVCPVGRWYGAVRSERERMMGEKPGRIAKENEENRRVKKRRIDKRVAEERESSGAAAGGSSVAGRRRRTNGLER